MTFMPEYRRFVLALVRYAFSAGSDRRMPVMAGLKFGGGEL